jgi:putative ABC transport system substrate-binding protein
VRSTRRQLVECLGLAGLGLLVGCGRLPGQAQAPPRVYRVGYLGSDPAAPAHEAFREGLRELGWSDGGNLRLEYRWADRDDELPGLAADLARLPVDVIVAAAGTASTGAARQATSTIPIVFTTSSDPIGRGLAESLARPGGNATGLSVLGPQVQGKRLELLKEVIPGLARVIALIDLAAADPANRREIETAAHALGMQVRVLGVGEPEEVESLFETIAGEHGEALLVLGSPKVRLQRGQIADLAIRRELPSMGVFREFAEAGMLLTYGPNLAANYRRAAAYVDKILKGARPADLPVEQPREFDFAINLKTAQALGLTIPQHILLQATEVFQ